MLFGDKINWRQHYCKYTDRMLHGKRKIRKFLIKNTGENCGNKIPLLRFSARAGASTRSGRAWRSWKAGFWQEQKRGFSFIHDPGFGSSRRKWSQRWRVVTAWFFLWNRLVFFSEFWDCAMSAPLFGKEWISKSEKEHNAAHAKFQAAVTSAMSHTDDSIKMVRIFSVWLLGFWVLVLALVLVLASVLVLPFVSLTLV